MGGSRRPYHVARLAAVLILSAAGLGLVALAPATASCAGPQVSLEQHGAPTSPRRVGDVEHEKLLYDVSGDKPLRVKGKNLTFSCQDTASSTQRGCDAPVRDPVEPIVPMERPEVVLAQHGHRWHLGSLGDVAPDLSAQIDVRLPRAVRAGPATLSVVEQASADGVTLDLVVG